MTASLELVTPWFDGKDVPTRPGWYRVRKAPCADDAYHCMGWFDGTSWCCFEQMPHTRIRVRRALTVFQWQGLVAPCHELAKNIVASLDPERARVLRFKPAAEVLRQFAQKNPT